MKLQTKTLTGLALNYAVAKAEKHESRCEWMLASKGYPCWQSYERAWGNPIPDYSTDPAAAYQIIEREILNGLQLGRQTTGALTFCCYAEYQGHMWEQLRKHYGPTPLIAAMRCYVESKLGSEVDIPDELL